jgi:6-phosphogluconolactonase
MKPEIVVFDDAAALARGAADWIGGQVSGSGLGVRSQFTIALAGGSTPRKTYEELARRKGQLDVQRTWFLFGDERCVPPDHERSNYRMAREALFDPLGVPPERVLRMEGELGPEVAAHRYEERLRAILPASDPRLDLVLLGIGPDGHTASLFPGTTALDESDRWAVANWVPKFEEWRLTLTLPILNRARRVLFLVSGADKAPIVAEAFGQAPHAAPHPCERVQPHAGTVTVLLDRQAAKP